MTTLAGMTPQERKECVGMWAETSNGLAIIIEPFYTDGVLDTTVVFSLKPEVKIEQRIAAYVIPRPDLPRAWQADGTPPVGEWEYDYVGTDGCSMSTGELVDPKPGEKIRRWIGDWETAAEEEEA